MGRLGNSRLLVLADHLESGDLGHDEFDFTTFTNRGQLDCGTAGCAIGECPFEFPDEWEFKSNGFRSSFPHLINSEEKVFTDASNFFEISRDAANHLFSPTDQNTYIYGGKKLTFRASAKEVAQNIREYVKRTETPVGMAMMKVREFIYRISN